MLLRINPEQPRPAEIQQVTECLRDGGIIIYPTDTVYGMGCDIHKQRAVERICSLQDIDPVKAQLSIVCYDLSHLSDFAKVETGTYKLMRKALPGPFTFILEASGNVPKLFRSKKKTVGIRIPDNLIAREIVRTLGNPIMSSSIHDDDEVLEYSTDPEIIHEKYKDKVDMVIAGGYGNIQPSTIVDCTGPEIAVIRQGLGQLEDYL